MATKTTKEPTAKQEEKLEEVANPPAAGSVAAPTVVSDDLVATISVFDEKGKASTVDVPLSQLRKVAKECTRVCLEAGV